jgi:hypothetical protein
MYDGPERRSGHPDPRARVWDAHERDAFESRRPVNGRDGVNIRFPGGALTASGRDVVLLVVILAGFAGVMWTTYAGFQGMGKISGALVEELKERGREHLAITQGNRDLVCTLSMEQVDRHEALRFAERPGGTICNYALAIPPRRPK